jgi:pyrimidine-nucleoside phosphorylase/thymidine phosphorylase
MLAADVIRAKRDGGALTPGEIRWFVRGVTSGEVGEGEAAAFLMAVFLRGMDDGETAALTDAMMRSGAMLDLSDLPGPKADKHSTGGIGDKTSLVIAPAAAAAGAVVPMISGRGLGHTGGTLDKLEAIPGLRVELPLADLRRQLGTCGLFIAGQTPELCPADRTLYALRDRTSTVESIPLIVASILGKKLAEGLDALVLDVKTGSGAFMRTLPEARALARAMAGAARALGKRAAAVITGMDQPLGRAVGNALEVREAIDVLLGGGPADLGDLCRELGARLLLCAGLCPDLAGGRARHDEVIASGEAAAKFAAMIGVQGGDPRVVEEPSRLPSAPVRAVLEADRTGVLRAVDGVAVGRAAVALGAGRSRPGDRVDPAAGFVFMARLGDRVRAGDPLAEVHASEAARAEAALRALRAAISIGGSDRPPPPLIHEEI